MSSNFSKQKIASISDKIDTKIWYQKIEITQSKKHKIHIPKIIGIVSIFFIMLIWFWILKSVGKMEFKFDNILNLVWFDINLSQITQAPTIKQTDGKTNILIIGRWWEENDAPNLTDSILIASLNFEKSSISLFSIPRDLYVEFPSGWGGKINEAYTRWFSRTKNPLDGIKNLQGILTQMTGETIHYYVNLDFEWFRKIVDTLGGIEIDVPDAIVDTTYPGPNHTYQTFRISAWLQTLDGTTALKYARSRHSTSDFDRSLRQQLIIKALREKALSLDIIWSPSKIKSLYGIVSDSVETDLDLSQMIALALLWKEIPGENIVSSNLNDTCFYGSYSCMKGWFLYAPLRADFGWASVLLQNWGTKSNPSNYSHLLKYTNIVFNYPLVYSENLKINIFNATKVGWLASEIADELKKYGFNIPSQNSVGNTAWDTYEKSQILYKSGSGGIKPETVEALGLFIFWWSQAIDILPKYSNDPDIDIEIIIGDDYKYLNF